MFFIRFNDVESLLDPQEWTGRASPFFKRSNGLAVRRQEVRCLEIGGGKGIRTPDLLIANETLYQLSYTPKIDAKVS